MTWSQSDTLACWELRDADGRVRASIVQSLDGSPFPFLLTNKGTRYESLSKAKRAAERAFTGTN